MELVQHHCRNCGGALLPHSEGKLKCQNCGTLYDVQSAEKYTKQMRELFDEAKQEMINNLRRNLYNAINAEYISSAEVQGICASLKQYLPDDFQANFYEVATGTNVRRIVHAIRAIDVVAHYDDLDGVIRYLIRSLQSEYLLELNNLVERAFKQRDLQRFEEYCTYISEEAEKVQLGVYETKLPREVFVAYSSKDMDKVSELVTVLESQGLKCFVAARNLRHGKGAVENYNRALEEAMDHCRSFVFVSGCNSRNINCDALEIEIPYVEGKDIENSPAQYRNNYQSIPTQFKKPRVEYRIEESRGFNAADAITNKFFDGYERVYSPEEVAKRVMTQLVAAQSTDTDETEKKYCDACGHENTVDAKFCIECGNSTFVSSVAEFIQSSKKKQEQIQRDAARRVEEAQKAAKSNAAKASAPPPKKKKSSRGCLISLIIIVVVGVFIAYGVDSLVNTNYSYETPGDVTYNGDFTFSVGEIFDGMGNGMENNDDFYKEDTDIPTDGEDSEYEVEYDSLRYVRDGEGWMVTVAGNATGTLSGDLTIPDTIDGLPVVSIADNAFRGCKKLTVVSVPDSVEVIGVGAFSGCTGLKEIKLPFVGRSETSTDFYETAFGYIFGSEYYSGSVEAYGYSGSYYIPSSLTTVILNDVEMIEDYAFRNCTSIKSISLGDALLRTGIYAFENCTALTEITLPKGIAELTEGMFYGCTALTRVSFDSEVVTAIGARAFYGCTSLEGFNDAEGGHFVIPDAVTLIGDAAFSGCVRMKHLSVPFVGTQETATGSGALLGVIFGCDSFNDSLMIYQYYDLWNNNVTYFVPSALTSVTVTRATKIPAYAFVSCNFLSEISFTNEITEVGAYAFAECDELESISLPAITEIPEGLLKNCASLDSFLLSPSVTSIGAYAFYGCEALESLSCDAESLAEGAFVIPSTVKSIGKGAFSKCHQMTSISVPFVGSQAKAKDYEGGFGYIFGDEYYAECLEISGNYGSYFIPRGLADVYVTGATQIPAYAFQKCSGLRSITLCDTVKTVGIYAFEACSSLTSLSIPALTVISEGMVRNCTSLESFLVGDAVTDIGKEAFLGCSALTSLNSEVKGEFIIPSTVKTIGRGAFSGCTQMTSLTVPFVGYSANSEYPDGLFGYIFGNNYYSGGEDVYQNGYYACIPKELETVIVTNATKIVEYAFQDCFMLSEIFINPEAAASVKANAFDGCTAEVTYELPVTVD